MIQTLRCCRTSYSIPYSPRITILKLAGACQNSMLQAPAQENTMQPEYCFFFLQP
ncbi:hypothetical protein BACCAP_00844 [Pseudoflavonifractor capillosus ATCC 29799]|uniref:Uncharacterized protein n=1 Tax=Pseudoflavonifractor capillosus ATCC 29799 TaxID=411467 RepID=A6NRL6_9FIRM|nr:hypothetical protein BACCAP_00844 [Pseudoflavonifractor capillosus ATCC 29799]